MIEVVYRKGNYGISIEQINGFGKNPGLWVHKGNEAFKMASFGSFEKADLFCKYLEWFLFDTPITDFERKGNTLVISNDTTGPRDTPGAGYPML